MTSRSTPTTTGWWLASALALVLPLTACGGSDEGAGDDPRPTQLTVLAAASLTESFTALGQQFEDAHPRTTVRLAFDSSATLAEQAAGGAPADVLATADQETMADADSAGALAGSSQVFATNTLVLTTPADNPADIQGLDDLAGATYVICVPTAPCGKVAGAVLAEAGISAEPASLEPDVKAVLAKVSADEADAGLVYATDAVAAGDEVTEIELARASGHVTAYPMGVLEQAKERDLAQQFTDLVLSEEGQAVLQEAGFGPPPA